MEKTTNTEKYENEAKSRWGGTEAYSEYERKRSVRSDAENKAAADGLNALMGRFAGNMLSGLGAESAETQELVGELKAYITDNFYACDGRMLKCLGEMYVSDPRFTENIDAAAPGTAGYVARAINAYCK